ncbi:MAG: sigma-70 family RNA polymerase sigma factor [Candidatus Omnitrophica bacterium]|nr:sigma-70 family RNA polymerase sigma factor [Candidatus Omnitrophota bacterium]
MMERTDEELWLDYNSGDAGAFDALFQRHKGRIFNFALRLTGNRADAEDVTSEAFVQLFHRKFQDNGKARLVTWLFTVARNACLSRMRSAKRLVSLWFKNNADDGYEQWDIPDDSAPPDAELGKKETAQVVRRALRKLPVEQREALILREYFQKDYAEIAQILECSLENVKVRIFRGREKLREDLSARILEDGK